jgi:hypothetical protein
LIRVSLSLINVFIPNMIQFKELLSFKSFFHEGAFSYQKARIIHTNLSLIYKSMEQIFELKNKNQLQLGEFNLGTWFRTKVILMNQHTSSTKVVLIMINLEKVLIMVYV